MKTCKQCDSEFDRFGFHSDYDNDVCSIQCGMELSAAAGRQCTFRFKARGVSADVRDAHQRIQRQRMGERG